MARESLEEQIFEGIGFIVAVIHAEGIKTGRLISGDGGAFYNCDFTVLSYLPERGEVIEGPVKELLDFGAFIRVSTIEALCHVSQMADDFFSYHQGQEKLVGKKSGKQIFIDDIVRGRIVVVGLQRLFMRVGVSMRSAGLGKLEWIDEWKKNFDEPGGEE